MRGFLAFIMIFGSTQVAAQSHSLQADEGASQMIVHLAEVINKCVETVMMNDTVPLDDLPYLGPDPNGLEPDPENDRPMILSAQFQLADDLGIATAVGVGAASEGGLGTIITCYLDPDLDWMTPDYVSAYNWMDAEVRRLGALQGVEYIDYPGFGNAVYWCEPTIGVVQVSRYVDIREDLLRLGAAAHRFADGELSPPLRNNMNIACTEATS